MLTFTIASCTIDVFLSGLSMSAKSYRLHTKKIALDAKLALLENTWLLKPTR